MIKRLLLYLLLAPAAIAGVAQVPISGLPTYIGNPAGSWVPVVVNNTTRKMDAGLFGYKCFDSVIVRSGTSVDTFRFYNRNTGIVFTLLYSKSGGGTSIDTTSLSNRINLKLNKSDTAAMLAAYVQTTLALKYSDSASMLLPYLRKSDTAGMLGAYLRAALGMKYSDTAGMLTPYLRSAAATTIYATITNLALKVNISDTGTMLSPYLRSAAASGTYATITNLAFKLNLSDTAGMLSPYLRKADTSTLSARINLRVNISDTAAMLAPYLRSATATATYATIANDNLKVKYTDTAAMLSPYQRSAAAWGGPVIGSTFGGTGVNNGSKTITLGGNFTTSGAFTTTITSTATTSVTLPTGGTIYATGDTVSTLATQYSTPQLVASGSVSAAATMDINMSTYFNLFTVLQVELVNIVPSTDATDLIARVSADGTTFDAGAGNYRWIINQGNDGGGTNAGGQSGSNSATGITLNGTNSHVGNTASAGYNGTLKLFNPGSASFQPQIAIISSYINTNADGWLFTLTGAGIRATAQQTKGMRFLFSSGNITGKYRVWGLR